jgi:purine-binding chemotaxis protein CheW
LAEFDNDVTAEAIDVMPEEETRICLFSIGEDTYAIPVELLLEIIIPQKIFSIPTTPPHVLGVINLRGSIVPIVDIRPVLSLPLQSALGQIAIIKHGATILGISVDNVTAVLAVQESSIQVIPTDSGGGLSGVKSRSRFFKGIIQREAGVAALLNIERVLDEIKLT